MEVTASAIGGVVANWSMALLEREKINKKQKIPGSHSAPLAIFLKTALASSWVEMLDTSNQRLIKDYEFFWLVYNCPIPGSPRRTAHLPSLKYMTSLEETRTGYPAKCTANRTAKPNKGHLQKNVTWSRLLELQNLGWSFQLFLFPCCVIPFHFRLSLRFSSHPF